MKKILLALLLTINLQAFDPSEDDKILHMGFSSVAGMAGTALCYQELELSPGQSFWCGIGTSLVVGGLKELYDKNNGGEFDMEDMQANLAGGVLGSSFLYLRYEYKW